MREPTRDALFLIVSVALSAIVFLAGCSYQLARRLSGHAPTNCAEYDLDAHGRFGEPRPCKWP